VVENDERDDEPDDVPQDEAVELPIGPELDLHTFRPEDVASVVEEYLTAAAEKGLRDVRIIHGKGKGTLRRTVESVLARHPAVASWSSAPAGNWGATTAVLKGRPDP